VALVMQHGPLGWVAWRPAVDELDRRSETIPQSLMAGLLQSKDDVATSGRAAWTGGLVACSGPCGIALPQWR
jgi:hypothetical protein